MALSLVETPARPWQERRLGRTILKTYRDTLDLYEILPNNNQPRKAPKEDPELQRQIEANEVIFEPLLLEPHPEHKDKYRIIDGDRRWSNSKVLVEVQKKEQYRRIPAEITDRTLTEEERLRVWIYIHRQRKEWEAKEKEMVAYWLVNKVGRASAANILGITVRDLDKLVEIYDLSEKLTNLPDPGTSITWAREIRNLNKKLLTPTVLDTIIRRVNNQEITNSKDVRKLRDILRDPVAREIQRRPERIFLPGRKNPVILRSNSTALFLLQRSFLFPIPTRERISRSGVASPLSHSRTPARLVPSDWLA